MKTSSQRGSALLLSVIVTLVITVIAVAMIRLSSRELAGATSSRQNDALAACAEAGRQLFLSQFRSIGVAPAQLHLTPQAIDGTTGSTRVMGGHIDEAVNVTEVTVQPANSFGVVPNTARDLSNIISGAAQLGGTAYRVVVHCQDHGSTADATSGRQLEVEFGLRFGL